MKRATKSREKHEQEVADISRLLSKNSGLVSVKRAGSVSNLTRKTSYKETCASLDLSKLNKIVGLDLENRLLLAEPGVTMEQLVATSLQTGLIPQVVPEFRGITVGGAIVGGSLESSSHRYGQFNECCDWIQLLLGNGERITVSPSLHSDLFNALSGSYGTLGVITLAAIRLVPASPIRLTYHGGSQQAAISRLSSSDADFIDGLRLDSEQYVVMEGRFQPERPTLTLKSARAPWFYQRAYSQAQAQSAVDILTPEDYLFRYDRAAFWMGQHVLSPLLLCAYLFRAKRLTRSCIKQLKREVYPRFPHPFFRTVLAPFLSSQQLYKGWHSMPSAIKQKVLMVQDVAVPIDQAKSLLEAIDPVFQIYPLWLCPVRPSAVPQPFSPYSLPSAGGLVVNIGFYGVPAMAADEATLALNRLVYAHGGRVGLYSQCPIRQDEFWKVYDRSHYEQLRKKYYAQQAFYDLATKICATA